MTAHYPQSNHFNSLTGLDIFLIRQSIFLTPQELHVLYWAKEGRNNREIAAQLGTAACTVKKHKNNLIAKLGVDGKAGLQQFLFYAAQNMPNSF
jgi:DNA-binding CsgD family transcriptional regulator